MGALSLNFDVMTRAVPKIRIGHTHLCHDNINGGHSILIRISTFGVAP